MCRSCCRSGGCSSTPSRTGSTRSRAGATKSTGSRARGRKRCAPCWPSPGAGVRRTRQRPDGAAAAAGWERSVRLGVDVGRHLLLPLALRGAAALHPIPDLQPTYLPALEGPRERAPFEASRVEALRRMQPAFVVIGDSMAGSRIDPAVFARASGQSVAPLLYAGSGPAWWYLVLKNWVIASGIRPKA